jgi:signal transduction histidine kinase
VIRHAQAKHCSIRFSLAQNHSKNNLQIEIADDGIGLSPDLRAGVGLRSMRERSEELGGTMNIESTSRGTCITAYLPFGEFGDTVKGKTPDSDTLSTVDQEPGRTR